MLLYVIKHSRHDLANVVRELSKCMDDANVTSYQEIIISIKFLLDARDTCLKLKPNVKDQNWGLVVYIDSDWAENIKNVINVTRFIIYLLGIPICWAENIKNFIGVTGFILYLLGIPICWS
jgi:hypothetical protein